VTEFPYRTRPAALGQSARVCAVVALSRGGIDRTSSKGRSMAEKLDLNTASTVHLRGIKGLGPSRAEEIVRYRSKYGPFASVDDLSRVPHVGDMPPQELAKVKRLFTIAESGAQKVHKVNLNKASALELRQVPGIGASHAEAIMQHRREHGRIQDVNEIDDLPHFRDQSTLERQNIKNALEV
jgi:competence ComEA-like helix-hairpin-helix protein